MYRAFMETDTEIIYPHNIGSESVWVLEIGKNKPPPGYRFVGRRNLFVIHYIKGGKGTFCGQAFEGPCAGLLTPTETQSYIVAPDSPYMEQYWMKVSGPSARAFLTEAGFPEKAGVFPCPYLEQAFSVFRTLYDGNLYSGQNDKFVLLRGLFDLCSLQAQYSARISVLPKDYNPYVRKILKYIHENYFTAISEQDLAQNVHLSVQYMHRLFKEEVGVPPIRYLNTYRIQCAEKMLMEATHPIAKIAEACGFSDPAYFSYTFERYKHISPSKFRSKYRA